MNNEKSIVWFRQDLRISDNEALIQASKLGPIFAIYIIDSDAPKSFDRGAASKLWLKKSLSSLNKSLQNKLNIYVGKPEEIITDLIKNHKIHNVFCNICYEPWKLQQDIVIEKKCIKLGVHYQSFNSNYLWKPQKVLKDNGDYYKIFTAYKKKALSMPMRKWQPKSENLSFIIDFNSSNIKDIFNFDKIHAWQNKIAELWDIGEDAAIKKCNNFVENYLIGYKNGRNYPSQNNISKLSPHLHFGEISPMQIIKSINKFGYSIYSNPDAEHFLSEIIWREFSSYLLYHFKELHHKNFNIKFNHFPWKNNIKLLENWQTGKTGYPIIDAGMRELWHTGYMHNRVRMIVASFLVKNLNIHWHAGRDWFWDCLVDADLANNSASWQWVAGCGADGAPYFRIFNPVLQGEKFDSDGSYTRKFVPELAKLPNKYLFKPWTVPREILQQYDIILGKTYPAPIIDLKTSRKEALERYNQLVNLSKNL